MKRFSLSKPNKDQGRVGGGSGWRVEWEVCVCWGGGGGGGRLISSVRACVCVCVLVHLCVQSVGE